MTDKIFQIAIDGPSGAGKSTIAKAVAARLGIDYIDTGAMYRAVGLKMKRLGIPMKEDDRLLAMLEDTDIDFSKGKVYLDGEDVSGLIRTEEISKAASDCSAFASVRRKLVQLQQKMGLTYIFITHDLSVVNHFSDEIAVMYLGSIVEKAPSEELFANPIHPYTKALLSAIPIPDLHNKRQRISLKGEITSPINLPDECRFANRCFECEQKCRAGIPPLVEVSPNHFVACFNHGV